MIVRFPSYDLAALFVAQQRSEGISATILDEATCSLWGPVMVGGVRVLLEDASNLSEESPFPDDSQVDRVIRALAVAVVCVGAAFLLYQLLPLAWAARGTVLVRLVEIAAALFAAACIAVVIQPFLAKLRRGRYRKSIMLWLVVVTILFFVLMTRQIGS